MKREIEEAIRTAVVDAGQDESLSRRLVAWFEEVSSSNEMLTDRESTDRRLERLYEDTILPEDAARARIEAVLGEGWDKEIVELLGIGTGSEPAGGDDDSRPGSAGSSS